jgi:hypothetical protein
MSNAQTTSNILAYFTCGVGACGDEALDHGYSFKLMAKLNNPTSGGGHSLIKVEFEGSPDDGNAVSPVYPYVFVATDTGYFETSYSCDNTGPSLTLPYDQ